MSFFYPFEQGWVPTETDVPQHLKDSIDDINWDGVKAFTRKLDFYPDAEFLMFKCDHWAPKNLFIYALKQDDDVIWLNGTSPPLHEFNGKGYINLNANNALDYLMFFCFFVRGEEGPFYIIDTLSSGYLPNGMREGSDPEPGDNAKDVKNAAARLRERYQSPRDFGKSDDGRYRFSVSIFYSNAIFVADFYVGAQGMCEMDDDVPLLADLPIKIDAPIVPSKPAETLH